MSKNDVIWSLIAGFVFWPWLIGLADLAVWAVVGSPLTAIPWAGSRGLTLILWPIACLLCAMILNV